MNPNHPSHPTAPRPRRAGKFRFSMPEFLGALVLMLFVTPLVDELKYGKAIDSALITMMLIMGVLAVGRSHRTLVLAVALMLPAVATRWANHVWPKTVPEELTSITALVFIGFVEFQMLRFIFRAHKVNTEVLCAGLAGYLLLGVLWMSAYRLVSDLNVGAFAFTVGATSPHTLSQFEAYYFSYITLSTVGYGDIAPLTPGARTLAMTEAMTGTLYMAVLISRLVALYSNEKRDEEN